LNVDIFTLFPEWFEWFATQRQREQPARQRIGAWSA